jgi:hypothetical protein
MSSFRLEKWYMDATDAAGWALIAYSAILSYGIINLNYNGYTYLGTNRDLPPVTHNNFSLIVFQFYGHRSTIMLTIVLTLLGGALWGYGVEGSAKLLRPFGYYGALLGGMIGLTTSTVLFEQNFFEALAAFAIAAPWTQAIGRMRCMIQACCHGKITENEFGVHYYNDHSRVCKISGLKGKKFTIPSCTQYALIS